MPTPPQVLTLPKRRPHPRLGRARAPIAAPAQSSSRARMETHVFSIFSTQTPGFKYSSSTARSARAARVYDRSLLLTALKSGCKQALWAAALPAKGAAPLVLCLLAPISAGRRQLQREGELRPVSELLYLQRFQSKMNIFIYFYFFIIFFKQTYPSAKEKNNQPLNR